MATRRSTLKQGAAYSCCLSEVSDSQSAVSLIADPALGGGLVPRMNHEKSLRHALHPLPVRKAPHHISKNSAPGQHPCYEHTTHRRANNGHATHRDKKLSSGGTHPYDRRGPGEIIMFKM